MSVMSIVFRILHIPSGSFVTAFKHKTEMGREAIFYDSSSALVFLDLVVNRAKYISGGPIYDYLLGDVAISEYKPTPILSEFELLPVNSENLSARQQNGILVLKGQNQFTNRSYVNELL